MKVTRAIDGKQAVELFIDSPADTFDVILMDIMMPQMNGYEATRAIRKLACCSNYFVKEKTILQPFAFRDPLL